MRVQRIQQSSRQDLSFELLDDDDHPIPAVSGFMRHLRARGCSPNTLSAYAFDLLHFMRFLQEHQLTVQEFTPACLDVFRASQHAFEPQAGTTPESGTLHTDAGRILYHPSLACDAESDLRRRLVFLRVPDPLRSVHRRENPIQKVDDPALARVSERHRPFLGKVSRQRPIRRTVHVKTVQRVPRPMDDDQIDQLRLLPPQTGSGYDPLDAAWGLRPGEILNLQLGDLQYGRKRVVIRYRNEHPAGVESEIADRARRGLAPTRNVTGCQRLRDAGTSHRLDEPLCLSRRWAW